MMGMINNLLLSFVEEAKGEQARKMVLEEAGMVGREFRSELIYPEDDFQKLLGATLKVSGLDGDTAQKVFAEYCGKALLKKFPTFWKTSENARALLLKVPRIHRDLPAGTGEDLPEKLRVETEGDDAVKLLYESPNGLCLLMTGLAEFVVNHYGEKAEYFKRRCTRQGDEMCELVVRFPKQG